MICKKCGCHNEEGAFSCWFCSVGLAFKAASLWLFIGLISTISTQALAYSDKQAVKAIVGEAENQGRQGMLAVACAIRNRGTLKGVFGLHNHRVEGHKYSEKTLLEAQTAWDDSGDSIGYGYDVCGFIHGAKNWENVGAFGLPPWAAGMQVVYTWKDHKFFR